MWKSWKFWVGILLVLCIAGGGYYYYSRQQAAKAAGNYTTGTVEKGTISTTIDATGTINPVQYVDISTNVAGILEQVLVTENQQVSAGQVIAYIDSRQLQATADDAKATLDNKQADLERYSTLVNQGAVSQQSYDNALMAYQNAKAAYDRAEVSLSDATITSPMSGTVIGTPLKAGQTISTGLSSQMIIATVANLKDLEIYLTVDETDVGNVKDGQKVTFTVDAYPGKTYTGTVREIAQGTKGNMGTTSSSVVYYTVKVSIPEDQSAGLMPTMTARATIYGTEVKDTLVVPLTAVRTDSQGEYIYVIENGQPVRKSVTTGISGDSTIQILSGVKENDTIVVSGDTTSSSKSSSSRAGGPMF